MSDFLAGLSPEEVQRFQSLGTVDDRAARYQRQLAYGQALRSRPVGRYSTTGGAIAGAVADLTGSLLGAYQEKKATEGLETLGRERNDGRQAFLSALGSAEQRGKRQEVGALLAQRPFVPFATDYNAESLKMRDATSQQGVHQRQQQAVDVALLSGDPVLRKWAESQQMADPGTSEMQRLRLDQGERRLQATIDAERRRKEAGDKALSLREQQAKAAAENRERAAAAKKAADSLKIEEGLRKEVTGSPLFKNFVDSEVSHNNLLTASRDPSPAGDLEMIFEFMKTLDPTSVVKEAEQIQVQNATNIPGQYLNMLERFRNGQRLSPEQRADLVRVAGGIMGNKRAAVQKLVDGYRGITERAGADFRNVMPLSLGSTSQAAAPRTTTAPTAPDTTRPAGGVDIDLGAAPKPTAPSGAPTVLMLPDGRRVRRNADGTYSPE